MFPLFFFHYIEPVRGFLVGRAPLPVAPPSGSAVPLSRFVLHGFLVRSSLVRCRPGRAPWVSGPYRVLLSFYTRSLRSLAPKQTRSLRSLAPPRSRHYVATTLRGDR